MLQVELRERMSTLRLCNSLKRSLASSGMNFMRFGSSKIAAATARQKSTSKPVQLPFSSGIEKPGIHAAIDFAAADRPLQRLGVIALIGDGNSCNRGCDRQPNQQAASECAH